MTLLRFTDEKPDIKIAEAMKKAIELTQNEFAPLRFEGPWPTTGIGISELRPRMFMSADHWQFQSSASWADWINKTISDNAYILMTGILNRSITPIVTDIWPSANGYDMPRMNVEQM